MASGSASVIDLTLEPDSPELQPRTVAYGRRGEPQPGPPAQVIDLTGDADDDDIIAISGSRTLPGRSSGAGRGYLDSRPRMPAAGNSGGGMASEQQSRAHSLMRLTGLNAFGVGGFEGIARFTNYALDNIPSLGSSGGSGSGSRSGSDSVRSGRPQGITARRRQGRQAPPVSSRRPAGAGGGNAGVRGSDVFFGAASIGSLLDPLGGNQPDLNYGSNGYMQHQISLNVQSHRAPNPSAAQMAGRAYGSPFDRQYNPVANLDAGIYDASKPPYVAPADPPDGFSRSTGEDLVAVCVGCDEELAYDSNDGPSTAKRKQSRKEREEHPFWAVTGCGHVYCRRCFDNRRNVLKGDKQPAVEFKTDGKTIFCAAEGCRTDVTAKKAWIGLFV